MPVAARVLSLIDRFAPPRTVHAHCDIPCGVYDPEQARIEAESCYKIIQKYHDSDDPLFKDRCVIVKEERAQLAKEHLYVLWSDHFKPEHLDEFPNLHEVFWKAAKACSQVKRTMELDAAQQLLDLIDDIDEMWKKTGGPETTRKDGRPS